MYIQKVALHNVRFFAFHGFYPEEQILGSVFLVNVEVSFVPSNDTENLQATINYEELNVIVEREMKNTQKLLETVVQRILHKIVNDFSAIIKAKVEIRKQNPLMKGEVAESRVELMYQKD